MYTIKSRLGMKRRSNYIIQDEKDFNITLSSAEGVIAFIREQNPFINIEIKEGVKDVTHDFIGGVRFVLSRYNQPIVLGKSEQGLNIKKV